MRYLAIALLVLGCGDDSAAPSGSDSGVDAPAIDAPSVDAPRGGDGGPTEHCGDAGASGPGTVLYLNFDGVMLVHDGTANDARTNHTFLIPSDKTVPPFLNGMAGRDTVINTIVAQLAQELAPYNVTLTRTRPASGDYMMIVFGGDSASIVGTAGFGGYAPLDCDDLDKVDLMLVFDTNNAVGAGNVAMFDLGLSIGLSVSTRAGDCLSRMPPGTPCMLSDMSPVDLSQGSACPGAPSIQDELAYFAAALTCR